MMQWPDRWPASLAQLDAYEGSQWACVLCTRQGPAAQTRAVHCLQAGDDGESFIAALSAANRLPKFAELLKFKVRPLIELLGMCPALHEGRP